MPGGVEKMNFIHWYLLLYVQLFVLYLVGKSVVFQLQRRVSPFQFLRNNLWEGILWLSMYGILAGYGVLIIFLALEQPSGQTLPFLAHNMIYFVGIALSVVGAVVMIAAQHQMAEHWRMGNDYSGKTELLTRGMFGVTRNPVYLGVLMLTLGVSLLLQLVVGMILFVVLWLVLRGVVRTEEDFLEEKFGMRYEQYKAKVGRFW